MIYMSVFVAEDAPILRVCSTPIKKITKRHKEQIEEIKKAVLANPGAVAIAANQIGYNLRAFVCLSKEELMTIINPKIVWTSMDDIEDIVMIFTGFYPSRKDRNVSYQSYSDGNTLRIEIRTPSGNSKIILVGNDGRLQKYVQNDESGKEMYHAIYEDYKPQSYVAGKITINMADGVTSICVKYSDIKIEKVTDMSIFELPVPTGMKSIYLN